ncbi:MAG TPA: hemerythrin domain-containing protein [Chitinophagales bacterium]|nr:hemerythrin domain-containing protein [Chitinophagales bacterium]
MPNPIKRHKALQPLSREHHGGLLLCWKIREGFKRNIEPVRIKQYALWYWQEHLLPHFEAEENHVFTLLPANDELVIQALAQHQRLKNLFEQPDDNPAHTLALIESELNNHIRFEERVLFNKIQEKATPQQLQWLDNEKLLENPKPDNWEDAFWV